MAKRTKQKLATEKKPNVKFVLADLDATSSDEELANFIHELSGSWPADWDPVAKCVKPEAGGAES